MKVYDEDVAPRRHRLKVLGYEELYRAHRCQADGCRPVLVDLFTSSSFSRDIKPEELIGREVDVAFTFGFVFLAEEARFATSDAPALEAARPELVEGV